ncbi:MAG: DNA repair protein RadA [Ignavibacteriales bacterium]|nr:DNA repair protein RadA [Ignavibacteriales bacterium]
MSKMKIKYICSNCGFESLKWLGKCPSCEEWNSFTEELVETKSKRQTRRTELTIANLNQDISNSTEVRIKTNISEFDRVLGGGIMSGSVILIGGDPGIGKSTLVLQAASTSDKKVLYVTGEESLTQISLRAKRLNINSEKILVLTETNLDDIIETINKEKPELVVIDSIQTVYKSDFDNAPGTITQIRECTAYLMQIAKKENCPIIIVGHITKEGIIAGPKVLEHIVDTVIQFEGDKNHSYRILRAHKNRYGGTNEIGIFEMFEDGLKEVLNPSQIFLSNNARDISGAVVTTSIEGSRPVLLEVQALVTPSNFGNPQRVATGFDYRRLSILLAVLERRASIRLSASNVFLNMAGGIRIDEPAVDLAVCCSIASSVYDKSVNKNYVLIGEIGLGGELRTVSQIEKRIQEAEKLGFNKVLIPVSNQKSELKNTGIEIITFEYLKNVLDYLFKS